MNEIVKSFSDIMKEAQKADSSKNLSTLMTNTSGDLLSMSSKEFLASLFLTGSGKVKIFFVGSVTTSSWLENMKKPMDTWNFSGLNPGDIFIGQGSDSDTNKQVWYYATVTEIVDASRIKVVPFLLLIEGEPPLWANTSLP